MPFVMGWSSLQILSTELTDLAIQAVGAAADVRDYQLAQLAEVSSLGGLEGDVEAVRDQLKSDRPWRGAHGIDDACARIRERYVEVRKGILGQQSADAEKAQGRIRRAAGFEKLTADQSHRVLKPILDAVADTTADAVSPTLRVLRDMFAGRIAAAEEEARDRLDAERNKGTEVKVVKVEANFEAARCRAVTSFARSSVSSKNALAHFSIRATA